MKGRFLISTVNFLTSIRTSLWLISVLTFMLLAGAVIMPLREEFQSIHTVPLLLWIVGQPLSAVWWLWAAIGLLGLLTLNTLACSIESVLRKRAVTSWLLLIAPQVIHAGFLFILLAHLMSSIGGFKGMAVAAEGTVLDLPGDTAVEVRAIRLAIDQGGYLTDWTVDIAYIVSGRVVHEDSLRPNEPSFRGGYGIYVKDLRAYPTRAVLLEVAREPGAVWALAGGILFTAGTVLLLGLKMRRERQ